jgi:hypothetical protein
MIRSLRLAEFCIIYKLVPTFLKKSVRLHRLKEFLAQVIPTPANQDLGLSCIIRVEFCSIQERK